MSIKIIQLCITGIAIIGTMLVFYNSPFVHRETLLYSRQEMKKFILQDKKTRNRAKFGFILILLSYIFQSILIFVF